MAPEAMAVVAIVGALTALFAASIGLVQNDIKRVLAYSTVSQLGYMFLALGVGAFAAGVFHLMTHAFFKALLFLGSGSVIHALHHEQDMRKMGALRKKIPITFATMAIGTLAIAGTPLLSGFFSKDEILWKAFSSPQGSPILWLIGVTVAGMTAFYMFRLLFMTFYGESRVDHHVEHHIHESPRSMTIPLMVLAAGSVLAGYLGIPAWLHGSNMFEHWLAPVFAPLPVIPAVEAHYSHAFEAGMAALSVLVALTGAFIAYRAYGKKSDLPARVSTSLKGVYTALLNKWYIDEVYDAAFVHRAKGLGVGLWRFDSKVVDGLVNAAAGNTVRSALGSSWWDRWIVDGLVRLAGGVVKTASWPMRLIETGYTQNYALVMILGVLVFIAYVLWGTP
jgi:NADH-quinone oxidoreductase subunit L